MNAADLELLQRELDGENSPEEKVRVQTLLANDPAAQTTYDELRMVATELEQLPLVEPPDDLWMRVMNALPEDRAPAPSARSSWWDDLKAALVARPATAFVYAFGIGLLVGGSVYSLVVGDRTSEDDLYGVMMQQMTDSTSEYESAFELPGFYARVRVYATPALLVFDMQVEADEPTDVRLVPEGALLLKGLTHQAGTPTFSAGAERIELHLAGVDRYTVLYNRPGGSIPPIRYEIWRRGEQLFADRALVAQ